MRRVQRGFSLLEMLIVMVISLILAAMAIPNVLQYLRNYRVQAAAQQVAGDLQSARMRALAENVRYRMDFTPPNTYELWRRDPLTQLYPGAPANPRARFTLPQRTSFTAVVPPIPGPEFTPSGTVTSCAAPCTIGVQNEQGMTRTITISAAGSIRTQ